MPARMPFAYAFASAALGRNHSSATLASRTKRCARTLIAHLLEDTEGRSLDCAQRFPRWQDVVQRANIKAD